jgi:ABC-type lipoprotein release transport system permease subunit
MLMLIKLAWRNIFRNKRRTLLSGLAIGVGLGSMMFADAIIFSLGESMVHGATESFSGNAQIHNSNFVKNFEVEQVINNNENNKILSALSQEVTIKNFAPRVVGHGMLTSTFDANNIMVYGVDPEMEKTFSKISTRILKGEYLNSVDDRKVLIGKKLAENLNLEVGDRVVITVARTNLGDLSQEMFRVGGIFSLGDRTIDENVAFINLTTAQKIFNLGNNIHEIAITFKDLNLPVQDNFVTALKYSKGGNELLGWNKMFKELAALLRFTQFTLGALAIILFSIIAIGIMNTIFMSLYERMFEFGVLRAVGTRPRMVATMILYETFMLALLSTVIGIILGVLFIYGFSHYGIDYRGIEYAHVVFKDKIYPEFRMLQFVLYPPCLMFFAMLVGIYPAIYASQIIPAKALRKND